MTKCDGYQCILPGGGGVPGTGVLDGGGGGGGVPPLPWRKKKKKIETKYNMKDNEKYLIERYSGGNSNSEIFVQ